MLIANVGLVARARSVTINIRSFTFIKPDDRVSKELRNVVSNNCIKPLYLVVMSCSSYHLVLENLRSTTWPGRRRAGHSFKTK